MALVGVCWFAHELGQRAPLVDLVGAGPGDMPAFERRDYDDSGGLGFLLLLLGLVPMLVGVTGVRSESRRARAMLALELQSPCPPVESPPTVVGVPRPTRARASTLDRVSFAAAFGVAVVIAACSLMVPPREPSPPEQLVREIGLPVQYYRRAAQGPVNAKPGRQPPSLQHQQARGVGVAYTISLYGPPDEIMVIDSIEDGDVTREHLLAVNTDTPRTYPPASARVRDEPGFDRRAAWATIRRRIPGLQACRGKHHASEREGEMTFTIELSTKGRVTHVEIDEDPFRDEPTNRCMSAKISTWRFIVEAVPADASLTFSVCFGDAAEVR